LGLSRRAAAAKQLAGVGLDTWLDLSYFNNVIITVVVGWGSKAGSKPILFRTQN
jgi:hypothetical protein